MRKTVLIVISVMCFLIGRSQTELLIYNSANIADSLKENANAVLRLDEAKLDVISASKYVLQVHQVVTVLNSEGASYLRHSLGFDKFYNIGDVAITVYNALGLPVKKYSKKDFEVQAAYDGFSLATDDKVMRLVTPAPSYPCTIDVLYEIKAYSYIELPDWYINASGTSTELFRYIVTVADALGIRYHSANFDLVPSIQTDANKKVYTWEARNIKAEKTQLGGFKSSSYFRRIEVAPNFFEYDGNGGNFSSWKDFGKWNFALYQDKSLSEDRKRQINALVANYSNTKDKVAALYDYLKTNVRYVSIQFGIGGYKPFPVKFVDEKKYGDCKALTNYMRYLLDAAGIKSYPALINAGNESPPADPKFPSSPFNHVILCVPNKADTIWLECTSNNLAAGFLGTFTENKNALVLTENGGVLTRTPSSKADNNLLEEYTEIHVNEQGGAKAVSKIFSTGDIAQEFNEINKMDADDQKEIFVNHLDYKAGDIFEISPHRDSANRNAMQFNFEFERWYAFKAGSKYFFPQKLNRIFFEDMKDEKRTIDYLFDYPYQKTDTTVIYLPKEFVTEELPMQQEIRTGFADYKKQIVAAPGKITIVTSLSLKQHVIPAEQYKTVQAFFAKVKESEEQNVVVKKP
ncbi:MAG TPA: DUF3857 domain-containing protein [Flavisolibacter sp.]|jgi:transglutaminase-like putative cysteine protease|nr:DUF3857 domain-containing protein [Flavisolibacter sp.]